MRVDYAKLRRQRETALKAHNGDPVAASLAHHKERLRLAVDGKDYSGMRDAAKAIADLEALLRARPPC